MCLAVVLAWSAAPLAFEPLTEEELDCTVASGLETVSTSDLRQEDPYASEVIEDGQELSDAEEEVTLVAYRQALPIVMSRMTNANRDTLGRHGSYSLSAVSGNGGQMAPARSRQSVGPPNFSNVPIDPVYFPRQTRPQRLPVFP